MFVELNQSSLGIGRLTGSRDLNVLAAIAQSVGASEAVSPSYLVL